MSTLPNAKTGSAADSAAAPVKTSCTCGGHPHASAAALNKSTRTAQLGTHGEALHFVTYSNCGGDIPYASVSNAKTDTAKTCVARIGPEVYGIPANNTPSEANAPAADSTTNALCPIYFYGTSTQADFLDGVQWCEVSGIELRPISIDGKAVGVFYEDAYARYALLGNLLPPPHLSRAEQTRAVFESMEAALATVQMDFSHVIRTWFYNDKILDWYDVFNRARDAFFEDRDVFGKLVPASTGVGSANICGSALMARAFAVQPKSSAVSVQAVTSPLQCSAQDYRSSFSRAVEITHPHFRQLIISGTASIHQGGKSAYEGDITAQIKLSMQVVEQILHSRNMGWADTVRAVVYLKDKAFATDFAAYLEAHGLQELPCVLIQSDVCRDELLFEIELDAVRNLPY